MLREWDGIIWELEGIPTAFSSLGWSFGATAMLLGFEDGVGGLHPLSLEMGQRAVQ